MGKDKRDLIQGGFKPYTRDGIIGWLLKYKKHKGDKNEKRI